MSARLVPVSGETAPVIQLRRPVQLVGRHPECDLRIEQMKVSRRHCCLALVYERVIIRELGSRNGVRVNGVRVEEATLQPGDEIAIGPVLYRVEGISDTPVPLPRAGEIVPSAVLDHGASPTPSSLPELKSGSRDDLVPLLDV